MPQQETWKSFLDRCGWSARLKRTVVMQKNLGSVWMVQVKLYLRERRHKQCHTAENSYLLMIQQYTVWTASTKPDYLSLLDILER